MEFNAPPVLSTYLIVCFNEFLGTLMLQLAASFVEPCVVSVPLILLSAIIITAKSSNAHFNPAVSLGFFLTQVSPKRKYVLMLFFIIVAQIVGSFAGLLIGFAISGKQPSANAVPNVGGTFLNELFCSFVLLLVILYVTEPTTAASSDAWHA